MAFEEPSSNTVKVFIYCFFEHLWIKISQIKIKIPTTVPTPDTTKAENKFVLD